MVTSILKAATVTMLQMRGVYSYDAVSPQFTGKERDSESGLDNFGKRYDSSSLGRFMSPDPVVITTERLKNPQQLNLYAYVANNPLRFIDPTGERFCNAPATPTNKSNALRTCSR